MPEPQNVSCERPAGGPVAEPQAEPAPSSATPQPAAKDSVMRIGHKAPDFTAPAYFEGGFGTVRLSEYLGKWVVLCFYPGDFTFV